jgi:hypothetical protein
MRPAQIAHKSPSAHCAVNLEGCGKDSIGKGQRWPSASLAYRLFNTRAKIAQQFLKPILLTGLRCVVRWPVLSIG